MALTRYLGRDGRIAIPPFIRERLDLQPGDLLSFAMESDAVVIRRERFCNRCDTDRTVDLDEIFDSLNAEQQQALVSRFARKLLTRRGGARCGRN